MRTRRGVGAGTTTRGTAWWLPVVVVVVILAAWAVRAGVGEKPASTGLEVGALASAPVSSPIPSNAAPSSTPSASVRADSPQPVDPIRTEGEIAQIATTHLANLSHIAEDIGLTPVETRLDPVVAARWADVGAYEPRIGDADPSSPDATRIVWVARGEGTFLVTRTGRSGRPPWVGATGYLLIDDETGEIVGMGTP
jgi:hypothetical protein